MVILKNCKLIQILWPLLDFVFISAGILEGLCMNEYVHADTQEVVLSIKLADM